MIKISVNVLKDLVENLIKEYQKKQYDAPNIMINIQRCGATDDYDIILSAYDCYSSTRITSHMLHYCNDYNNILANEIKSAYLDLLNHLKTNTYFGVDRSVSPVRLANMYVDENRIKSFYKKLKDIDADDDIDIDDIIDMYEEHFDVNGAD